MRVVLFSPYFRTGINPRRIRLDNLTRELAEMDIVSLNSVSSFQSTQQSRKKFGTIKTLLKKIAWPDVFLLHSLYYLVKYLLFKREKEDVIYTVSNPFSMHWCGLFLKKFYKLTWYADIGDPFHENQGNGNHHFLYSRMSYLLEKKVLFIADKVIVNSSILKEFYIDKYKRNQSEIIVIPNGFRIRPEKIYYDRGTTFTLSYIGNTYNQLRNGLKELNILLELQKINSKINLRLIGDQSKELLNHVEHNNLQNKIFIEKAETIEILEQEYSNASILLIFSNKDYPNAPSKLEEYLCTKKPILYFYYSENEAVVKLLKSFPGVFGICIDLFDRQKIVQFIENAKLWYERPPHKDSVAMTWKEFFSSQ